MSSRTTQASPGPFRREIPRDLIALRARIDDLNLELLDLVEQRGRLILLIAAVKREAGVPLRDPEREEEMLDQLAAATLGPFSGDELRDIFTALFRASCALLHRGVVAGPGSVAPHAGGEKEGR